MSLFGCKEKRRIANLEHENDLLKRQYNSLVKQVEEITELSEHIPEDCTKGPWCENCAFNKTYAIDKHYGPIWSSNDIEFVYVCVKNGVCKNFVEKAEES